MKRIQIYFPEKLLTKTDNLSKEKGISRSELIRQIIFSRIDNDD